MAVKGLVALRLKLRALPDSVKKEIRKPMEDAAQNIVDLAYHLCPVLRIATLERKSGALRSSIDWNWGAPPGGLVGPLPEEKPQPGDLRLSIHAGGPDAPYAGHVEFGTGNTPAQPFFYSSYRRYRKAMRNAAARAANKGLKALASTKTNGD